MNIDDPRRQARRHVKAVKGFYIHAFIFCVVNGGLLIASLTTPHTSWRSVWPMVGWGVGLAANWVAVFRRGHAHAVLGQAWEDRKVEEYLSRQGQH